MSLKQHHSKEDSDLISSEYDRYRSEAIDKIDDLLLISQITEMESRIHKNCLAILKIMKNFQNKLFNNYELKKEEIENFIYCLKFIDTLNIFMNNSMIDSMLKLTEDLTNLIHSNTLLKNKDDLLHKIQYAEKSIVYFKKKTFKNVYFSDTSNLYKEIEKSLNSISQSYEYTNNFDRKIFKQMQNIFWVLQKKLTEDQKNIIQSLIDDIKNINIKSRTKRYNSYYDYNESETYYSSSHNNYSNNYYKYSNYNNPIQNRRSDYYDPHYKRMDLIELPDVFQKTKKQEGGFTQSELSAIQDNNTEFGTSQKLSEEIQSNEFNKDKENFFNEKSKHDNENNFPQNDKNDFNNEKHISNRDYTRINEKSNPYQKSKKNKLDSKTEDTDYNNAKNIKDPVEIDSINQITHEKINNDIYKVVEVDINDSKSKLNELNDLEDIQNNYKNDFDKKEKSIIIENSFNRKNIETVIVSSTWQNDLNDPYKQYNYHSNKINSKINKKHKDTYNISNQSIMKNDKLENKNPSKKSKRNKSEHLFVESDYFKSEKSRPESYVEDIDEGNSKLLQENEDSNAKNNENMNKDSNLASEAENIAKYSDKINKENIEIVRHYQSDYDPGKYGKYNSKYQKYYTNYYNKQTFSFKTNKTSFSNKDVESQDSITDYIKSPGFFDQKSNNDELIVSNFNTSYAISDKDNNNSNVNNKITNNSNPHKFRNKSYSNHNSYNYSGYNNYRNNTSFIQEKVYCDKESYIMSEIDKKNKYVIKEVEILDNKAANMESIEIEINKDINNKDNNEALIVKKPEAYLVENQLVESHSDLEANLKDLKFMDLKVNFEDYSKNHNFDEKLSIDNQIEKHELKIDSLEQNKQNSVAYETIKTYVDSHPRYNSGSSYKSIVKNKIGKYGKYQQCTTSGANNANNLNNDDGDNSYNYYNKQTFNKIKDDPNNFLNKNYNNNPIESNKYYQNLINNENFIEKSNCNTAKKKNYINNYKPEKDFDLNMNNLNEDESFNYKKIIEYNSKDISNNDDKTIEIKSQNKDTLKHEKENEALNENNDVNDIKKDNSNNELFNNNNNFYSNKGYSNNFNSLNNNNSIDNRENVYNKNYQENSYKVYKDHINTNNINFVTNKNNSYLKNEKGNNIIGIKNENEIYSNLYQDQINNYDENKSKNKKHSTFECEFFDNPKGFRNNRNNQNNPSYLLNQAKEVDDYVSKLRGREDYYDYSNKIKSKKGKINKSINTNVKANNSISQNDDNYIKYDEYNNPAMMNSNLNPHRFLNSNNMKMGLYQNIHNISNYNFLTNYQNSNNKKPITAYKYNTTEIGLFSNLLGSNNKTNYNLNNFPNINPNNMMNHNMNMFNLGMLNYIHQMNMFNQMNSINNSINKIDSVNPLTENKVELENGGLSSKINEKLSEDSNNERSDNKIKKKDEDLEKTKRNDTLVNNFFEKYDAIIEPALNNREIFESEETNKNHLSASKENDLTQDLKQITIQKEIKPIGIFNMDIEKFFQSEAKDINLENISQLEKKKDEIIHLIKDSSKIKIKNIKRLTNPESLSNQPILNKTKNSQEKYEFTSENDTEKENLNDNSSEQNQSDEEPSSVNSDSIPNEDIQAAFENFHNEIRYMHSMPIPGEVDDDYYIGESDYMDENKEKVTKNNKAIFEEGDAKQIIEGDGNIKKDLDASKDHKKENINTKNLNDVDINFNEGETVENQIPKDNEIFVNSNVLDIKGQAIFNNEIENNDNYKNKNDKIDEFNNLKNLNQEDLEADQKLKEKQKSKVNNQIYNNFNFYNMQMIANPNMIKYFNSLNNQKEKNINTKKQSNGFNMMDNSKLINMNYGIKNVNNMGLSMNYNANIYLANQTDPKNLREQTKSYTDSVKTIDPDLLKIIKNKLTENTNTNSQKNSINLLESISALKEEIKVIPAINEEKDVLNPDTNEENKQAMDRNLNANEDLVIDENKRTSMDNSQINNSEVIPILNSNQDRQYRNIDITQINSVLNDGKVANINGMNKNIQYQNYLMSNWANFIFRGRDSNIHREYITLKYLEQENPLMISKNIEGFEDRILIPVYQKLIFNVNKRKGVYFFTFNRYRKIICKVLQNSKILKKVKPYGSLMNNFMIDSGDIDICIVPNCGILEFALYLDKIKEELISQVFIKLLFKT